ncbi:MAG: ERCC4 domain-containing protein [Desulfobacterales bacterium]|nr:ERCC4 domain-containing protein [Desulfobacterales bacterium]
MMHPDEKTYFEKYRQDYITAPAFDLINILADDREQKSDVIRSLSGMENVKLEIQRLSIGDYQVDNRVLVERKTLKDFAISIIDGRLFRQMIRLTNSAYTGVLILEGTAGDTAELGVTREAMQGALITVSLILGIPVLRAKDSAETARLIVYMARQLESIARGGVHRPGYRPRDKRKKQLFILQGLPGVGPERAGRLLDKFGSVEAVISAGSDELEKVYGIGNNVAEKIRWAVSEEIRLYGNEITSAFESPGGKISPNPSFSKRGINSFIDRKESTFRKLRGIATKKMLTEQIIALTRGDK